MMTKKILVNKLRAMFRAMFRAIFRVMPVSGCLYFMSAAVFAETTFTNYVEPLQLTNPAGLEFFYDKNGALGLGYLNKNFASPGEYSYLIRDNGQWSSPIELGLLNQNKNDAVGVVNLSSGTPLLLIKGDDTDYAALFNLSSAPPEPASDTDPIIPGVSQSNLEQILDDNQRLFYTFLTNTGWSKPQAIGGTSRAANAVLTAGEQNGALLVFIRDADQNSLTINDRELFYSVFYNHAWSVPIPITSNTVGEFDVNVTYVNGQYMVVWLTDDDNNTDTRDDWTYRYTTIGVDGALSQQQVVTTQQHEDTIPILGVVQNQATLIWMEGPVNTGDLRRPLVASYFNNGWSAPQPIGLFGLQAINGHIYSTGAGELLVYYDSGTVQGAINLNGTWQSLGTFANIQRAGFDLAELAHFYDQNNTLWLAMSAHISAAGEAIGSNSDLAGDGIYIAEVPISYDLKPVFINNTPYKKQVGGQATVNIKIGNLGSLPSPSYSILIKQNSQILVAFNGTTLNPGQEKTFSYTLTLNQSIVPLGIEIVADSFDADLSNNIAEHNIKVLPDYVVRSVKKLGSNQVVVDVIEQKGVAAAPVPVKILLIEQGAKNLIGTVLFDPNSAEPIVVESDLLVNKTGTYQLLAQVNPDRTVNEDNYSNNQSALNIIPAHDFIITRFETDTDNVHVTIRNQGDLPAYSIDLLVTDDPLSVASSVLPVTPWFYQQTIILGNNGEAVINIPRGNQAVLQGSTLYAIVNPLGQTAERDRNNNLSKMIVATADLPPPTSTPQITSLQFANVNGWCQNIQVVVRNDGQLSVVASSIEVYGSAGEFVARRTVPILLPGEDISVSFHDLPFAQYDVHAVYKDQNDQALVLSSSLTLVNEPLCSSSVNQDVSLVGMQLLNSDPAADSLILRVTIAAVGYNTHYRKPLVRLPLNITVKQGTTTQYTSNEVFYVPAASTVAAGSFTFDIPIPRTAFPSGTAHVEVQLIERNDERDSANNKYNIDVNAEAL